MANDKTVMLEWQYVTPCGACGKLIRIGKDASGGKERYNQTKTVRIGCKACGHEEEYPASAVDNKLI